MATIIVFASSLALVSLIVLIKAIEIKYSRKNFFLMAIRKLDDKSVKLVGFCKFKTLQLIQTARYLVLVKAKEFLLSRLRSIEEKIINEYKIRERVVMGRKEIINKGSVSFYLKKIDETKRSGTRGEIL